MRVCALPNTAADLRAKATHGWRTTSGCVSEQTPERCLSRMEPSKPTPASAPDAHPEFPLNFPASAQAARAETAMHTDSNATPLWNTACFHDITATSPTELAALGQHLQSCRRPHRRLFELQCAAEAMSGFATARFVTTLLFAVLVLGLLSLVL